MSFKVGDKVKRISGSHKQMEVGDVDIIENLYTNRNGQIVSVDLHNYGTGHSFSSLEKVDHIVTLPHNVTLSDCVMRYNKNQDTSINNDLYCSCSTPNKVASQAAGNHFWYCRSCKKEAL